MKKRQERLVRLNTLEQEFRATKAAINLLSQSLRADPGLLATERLRPADVKRARGNLEATYLVRLFGEFEAGLRDAWENALHQATTPRVKDLLDAIAARRQILDDELVNAHAVRKHRNALVHEGGEKADPISFELAKKYLCTFFSRLPLDW